jgi:hypothetical protein
MPGDEPPGEAVYHERASASRVERETGIEPATNSLEGCDSTTELLPPSSRVERPSTSARLRRANPPSVTRNTRDRTAMRMPSRRPPHGLERARQPKLRGTTSRSEGWWRGKDSNLRSPRATDLQSAAFDRFATSPNPDSSRDGLCPSIRHARTHPHTAPPSHPSVSRCSDG